VAATLLVVVGVVFLITAVRKWLKQPDEDAPPPAWAAMVQSASPGRAYALGVGIVVISAKLWAFTLAAIAAIADADLSPTGATLTYLVFVVLAASLHLGAVGFTVVAPDRASVVLDRLSDLLRRYDRELMTGLATVFGVWLLLKGLAGLQVI
jgi:drug/metabolite transporter (DMT)-like permease